MTGIFRHPPYAIRANIHRPSPLATLTKVAGAGQTAVIGLASTTESAFAMTHAKAKAINLASVTVSAFAFTANKDYSIGLASITASAFTHDHGKSKAIGNALESSIALPFVLASAGRSSIILDLSISV